MHPSIPGSRRGPIAALFGLVLAASLGVGTPAGAANPPTLYVRPGGTGDCRTAATACGKLDTAVARATSGAQIELAAGTYGGETIQTAKTASRSWTAPVVIRPAAGASVQLGSLTIAVHNLTIRGVELRTLRTNRPDQIRNLRLESVRVVNGTVLYNGVQGGRIENSEFRDGLNRDALNVKDGSVDVAVVNNWFHDYRHNPNVANANVHVDCLQVFGAQRLLLERNRFDNCSQRALILQVASTYHTSDVTVRNNWFGGCDASDNVCQTANVPFQATGEFVARQQDPSSTARGWNYTVVNNQMDGLAFVEQVPGLAVRNNVLGRFFHTTAGREICNTPAEGYNLVAEMGRCRSLSSTDRRGSLPAGEPTSSTLSTSSTSASSSTVDLQFADPAYAPPADLTGTTRCGRPDVGAWERQC